MPAKVGDSMNNKRPNALSWREWEKSFSLHHFSFSSKLSHGRKKRASTFRWRSGWNDDEDQYIHSQVSLGTESNENAFMVIRLKERRGMNNNARIRSQVTRKRMISLPRSEHQSVGDFFFR